MAYYGNNQWGTWNFWDQFKSKKAAKVDVASTTATNDFVNPPALRRTLQDLSIADGMYKNCYRDQAVDYEPQIRGTTDNPFESTLDPIVRQYTPESGYLPGTHGAKAGTKAAASESGGILSLFGNADNAADLFQSIGFGMQVGGQVGGSYGAYVMAKAAADSLLSAAAVTEDNARLMQLGVEQSFRAGEYQIAHLTMRAAELKAQQRTAYAANGVAVGVGSAAEVAASTDVQKEVDKYTAQMNALQGAWNYRRKKIMGYAQAKGQRIMAGATKAAGRGTMLAGMMSAGVQFGGGYLK